jgi:tetratricopeptide (TPR) repeat protein
VKAAERVLIPGVPYISYADALKMDYAAKTSTNPSLPASVGMVLRYYGQSTKLLKEWGKMLPEKGGWAAVEWRDATGLDELKPVIARGEPVVVMPALTPVAHPFALFAMLYPMLGDKAKSVLGDLEAPGSGIHGRMASFETFRKFRAEVGPDGPNPMRESAMLACRVLIGYDDVRRVVLLHDPSFGPAREIGYDDFERMWAAGGHACILLTPRQGQDKRKKDQPVTGYRALTPDEQAAWPYIYGYALLNIGQPEKALQQLRQAAATPGIGAGREHLILLETALAQHEASQNDAALATLDRATTILPECPAAWEALAHVCEASGEDVKASAARAKATTLSTDGKAAKHVQEVLPVAY